MPKYNLLKTTVHLPQPVKKIIPFLLFFIAIGINIYLRLFPAYLPQLNQEAKLSVENKAIENITKNVEESYPEFNSLIKKKIILETFKHDKKSKAGFKKEIQGEYGKLKDPYQDEHGQTYILEVDGYQWMRCVTNILKNGHPGTSLKNGRPYDDYMFAPIGIIAIPEQFFFRLSASIYRLTTFFFKNISLVSFLFYLPLLYLFLFLSILYLAVRTFFSDITAALSVFFIGLNVVILSHTCAGWFDYDALTFALPLVIVWLLSLSFKNKYTLRRRFFYVFFAALAVAIYSVTWPGYWWIFAVCSVYYLYIVLNTYSIDKKAHKEALNHVFLAAAFFVSSLALCSFVLGYNAFQEIFVLLGRVLHLGSSQQKNIWPNTFYTVGELVKADPRQILMNLGGPFIPLFALIGTLWIYIKERRTEKKDFVGLMVFWLFAMGFATFKALRFVAFLAIPLGIFFSAFIEDLFRYIRSKLNKQPIIFFLSLCLLFILVLYSSVTVFDTAFRKMSPVRPIMNDSLDKALKYLKKNTPQNSIIDSWWDFGNFFKTVSDRRVLFDPQSQNTALAYWMAQVFLETDETKAINILRMLNNSSNTLFEEINREMKDDFRSIVLLKEVLGCNMKDAEKILGNSGISTKLKNKIIETIFLKEPPPAYFVLDKSMFYKMHNISFLGNWDFSKLYVMRNSNLSRPQIVEDLGRIFSLPENQADKIYKEVIISTSETETSEVLSKRYGFPFSTDKSNEEGKIVYFDGGIILDLSDFTARVLTLDKGFKKYKYVFIYEGNKFSIYENKDTDYKESVLFVKNENNWQVIGLSKELAQSLFVKLYFLNGAGTKYFEPFYSDKDAGLYVYKIKWPKEAQ